MRISKLMILTLIFELPIWCLTPPVMADDGGISFGGSPKLLKGHASVAMKSEIVRMLIGENDIKVDCNFVFHNNGPTCKVRMGFPDQGSGAAEPYQGEELPKKLTKAAFTTYVSYVNGKKVPTRLISTDSRELFWHEKTVTFKGKSDTVIRDIYTLPPGAQVTNENGLYKQTYYTLHTGSSWHGPIGKATIVATFAKDASPAPLRLKKLSEVGDPQRIVWSKLPVGTVLYEGPSEPRLNGRELMFVCNKFKPTKKDDVHLYYSFRLLPNN